MGWGRKIKGVGGVEVGDGIKWGQKGWKRARNEPSVELD